MGLCAFVADGAILPRESGVSGRPMKDAVRFQSPESLSVTLTLPHHGKLTGMGIKEGHHADRRRWLPWKINTVKSA